MWLLCFHLLFLKELLLLLILFVEVVFERELAEQVEASERQSSWDHVPDVAAEHAVPLFVDLGALNQGVLISCEQTMSSSSGMPNTVVDGMERE